MYLGGIKKTEFEGGWQNMMGYSGMKAGYSVIAPTLLTSMTEKNIKINCTRHSGASPTRN